MGRISAIDDFKKDPLLAQAVGDMVIAWSRADIALFSTFARIAGIRLNMAMESWSRIPTFESRTKFLHGLLQEWDTKEFDGGAISRSIEKLSRLAKTRNGWVHGDWCYDEDQKIFVVFNHRLHPTHKERGKPVKVNEVATHCQALRVAYRELEKLIKSHDLQP